MLLATVSLLPLTAADFTLTIGNPIAANVPRMKTAGLAVRLENCPDLAKSSLAGSGEGMAAGARKSVSLVIMAGSAPGVYAVGLGAPLEGAWVANLKATCGDARASALVPFHGFTFIRESMKIFPRFATSPEIEGSLKQQLGGTK